MEFWFMLSVAASVSVAVGSFFAARNYHRKHPRTKRVFTAMQVFAFGIFISAVIQYLPIVYSGYEYSDSVWVFRPILLSLFYALKLFIIDGEYMLVYTAVSDLNAVVRIIFTVWCAIYFLAAPVLTAGAIASMFENITAKFRLRVFKKKRPLFVMSKLNSTSLSLARSIHKEYGDRAVIVFTDVIQKEEDEYYDLICESQETDINGICIKNDIVHLNLNAMNGRRIEFFLIDEVDESENVSQAIKLTELYKNRANTKIYVYANSQGSACIIDSLDKGKILLPEKLKREISGSETLCEEILYNENDFLVKNKSINSGENSFKIVRVNSVQSLILKTFVDSNVFQLDRVKSEKTISILIIGMGEYGKAVFKTALWFCQLEGYKLEINIVDSGSDRNGRRRDIQEVLEHECPEIFSLNKQFRDGDCNYDINIYKDINCFTSSFDDLFIKSTTKKRLKRTNLAFVSIGDDDKNIEVSMSLRTLFDKLQNIDDKCFTNENSNIDVTSPKIYAVVFDDKKADNLGSSKGESLLINHKRMPYSIDFIGRLSDQFSYNVIRTDSEFEIGAIKHHIEWINTERKIREAIVRPENFHILQSALSEQGVNSAEEISWGDKYLYDGETLNKTKALEYLFGDLEKYMQFEYFRNSSISKYIHKKALRDQFGDKFVCNSKNYLCDCEKCVSNRKTEHMRWNAYMRTNGYVCGANRADRARVHTDLVPWDELSIFKKYKD